MNPEFDTVKSVIYVEESHIIISKTIVFLALKIDFVFKLANNADPDVMPHSVVFYMVFSVFDKVPV